MVSNNACIKIGFRSVSDVNLFALSSQTTSLASHNSNPVRTALSSARKWRPTSQCWLPPKLLSAILRAAQTDIKACSSPMPGSQQKRSPVSAAQAPAHAVKQFVKAAPSDDQVRIFSSCLPLKWIVLGKSPSPKLARGFEHKLTNWSCGEGCSIIDKFHLTGGNFHLSCFRELKINPFCAG